MGADGDDYVTLIALIMLAIGAGIGYVLNENHRLHELTSSAETSERISNRETVKNHPKRKSKLRERSKSRGKSKSKSRTKSISKSKSRSKKSKRDKSKSRSRKSISKSNKKSKHRKEVESSVGSAGSGDSGFATSFQEKPQQEILQPPLHPGRNQAPQKQEQES